MAKVEPKKKNILDHYGIDKPFFKTDELKGNDLQRFVNRSEILEELQYAIDFHQNAAIIGKTGTGKSSILHKFKDTIASSYVTCYRYFSTDAKTDEEIKEELSYAILADLLTQIIQNDHLMKHYDPKKIAFETERLNYTISVEQFEKKQKELTPEIEANFSSLFIKSFLPLELKAKLQGKIGKEKQKSESRNYEKHNEASIKKTITEISAQLPSKIIFFIDEMDQIVKSIFTGKNWVNEVLKILQFSVELMNNTNLLFIYALQYELYDIFVAANRGIGDVSILKYVPVFCEVRGFDSTFAREAVMQSLTFSGYKGPETDLFSAKTLETVLAAAKGNPRMFMLYLGNLTKRAHKKSELKITPATLKEYLLSVFGDTGTEDWRKELT